MNEKEWQDFLKSHQDGAATRDAEIKKLLEEYKNSITEVLHRVGQAWSNKATEAEGLDNIQASQMRYRLHYYFREWRLNLWYGTYEYATPNLLDEDGEDFYHNDIKTFRPFHQRYTGFILITIEGTGFRLSFEDSLKNLFGFGIQHDDKTFTTFSELENALVTIAQKLKTHPIHDYKT